MNVNNQSRGTVMTRLVLRVALTLVFMLLSCFSAHRALADVTVLVENFCTGGTLTFKGTYTTSYGFPGTDFTVDVVDIYLQQFPNLGDTDCDIETFTTYTDGSTPPSGSTTSGANPQFFGNSGTTSNRTGFIAEPIDTATGNYFSAQTDLSIKGRGLPFVFNRYYNSLDSTAGPLGIGWTHSYNLSLSVNSTTGVVSVRQQDGSVVLFQPSSGGAYSSLTPGLFDTLTMNSNGSYSLRRRNQTVLLFSSAGVLLSVTDRNGNTQSLAYSGAGNLTSITDTVGRTITFTANGSNQIASMTDPLGRIVSYAYDSSGRLSTVTDPTGHTTTYTYSLSNQLLTGTDPRGVVYVQNSYDSLGRVISQTNGRGITWSLAYNSPTTGTTTITDGNGNALRHVYNSNSQLAQTIDGAGDTTSFSYDANNDITSVTDPKGNVTSHTYDGSGNVLTTTNALNQVRTLTYDRMNDVTSITDPAGVITALGYNATGNLISVTNGLGQTTQLARDAFGELLTVADPLGDQSRYSYDSYGDLIKAIDGSGRQWGLAYDAVSRPVALTDGLGNTWKTQYDALNRTISTTDALGNSTVLAYDPIGDLVKMIDANGNATQYAYDPNANLTTLTNALGHATQYTYDNNNNLNQVVNANGNATTYVYDSANRPLSSTDPLDRTHKVTYDADGDVVSFTDGNAETSNYAFDNLERILNITYGDGSAVGYAYDATGDLTQVADPQGTSTFGYDALHRIVDQQRSPALFDANAVAFRYDAASRQVATITATGATVSKTFDGAGRLSSVRDWNDNSTKYTYDAAGREALIAFANGVSTEFKLDADGHLLNILTSKGKSEGKSVVTSYAYSLDKLGNRLTVVTPLGSTLFTYDALSRIHSVSFAWSPALPYTYDPDGNVLNIGTGLLAINYAYNAADELIKAGPTAFTYDGNGSLLTRTTFGISTNFVWNAAGRLASVSGIGGQTSYTYDGLGLRLTRSTALGTSQYLYDRSVPLPRLFAQSTTWPVSPRAKQVQTEADIFVSGIGVESALHLNGSGVVTDIDYIHQDGLGSTVAVTNAKGFVEAAYIYTPWGMALPDWFDDRREVPGQVPFGFAGQVTDQTDGLMYMLARYYDPDTGRFISRDPRVPSVADAWDRNPYAYARNNPATFRDPSGLVAAPNQVPDATSDPGPQPSDNPLWPSNPLCAAVADAAAVEICGPLVFDPATWPIVIPCTVGIGAVTGTACEAIFSPLPGPLHPVSPNTLDPPSFPTPMPPDTSPNPCATGACFQPVDGNSGPVVPTPVPSATPTANPGQVGVPLP